MPTPAAKKFSDVLETTEAKFEGKPGLFHEIKLGSQRIFVHADDEAERFLVQIGGSGNKRFVVHNNAAAPA